MDEPISRIGGTPQGLARRAPDPHRRPVILAQDIADWRCQVNAAEIELIGMIGNDFPRADDPFHNGKMAEASA